MRSRFALRSLGFFLSLVSVLAADDPWATAGVAPTDKAWKGADCRKLAELVASSEVPKPLLKDETGARVLKRFCSKENLAGFQVKADSTAGRVPDFMEMLAATSLLSRSYIEELETGTKVSDEATLVLAHLLDLFAIGVEMVQDSSHQSPNSADLLLEKVKSGATEVFGSATAAVGDEETLTAANRLDLLTALARNVGRISKNFSRVTKAELSREFTKLREQRTAPAEQAQIDLVLKELAPPTK